MIPWVRKWVNSRKQRNDNNNTSTLPTASSSNVGASSSSNNCGQQQEQQHQSQKLLPCSSSPNSITRREERQKTSKLRSASNISPRRSKDLELKEKIRIRIITQHGRSIFIDSLINKKLSELKSEALIEFSSDSCSLPLYGTDIKQLINKYRLTRPDSAGTHQTDMQEDRTIAQLRIQHNETLVLSVKRTNFSRSVEQYQGPRAEDIEQATQNIPHPTREFRRVDINELVAQSDIQFDVRKVLISLAQESAYIIGAGPFAPRLILMLKQKLVNKRRHQSDTLQCLIDMGFSKEKSIYALKLNNGVYSSALEWLIQHQSEQELSSFEDSITNLSTSSNAQILPSKLLQTNSIVDNIESLLEIVRIYSYRDVPPQPHVVVSLVEMGFCEMDVREALRKTHNNQAAACEWLCGNRNASLMELREGLSHESPILKAMMQSPQVQISLSNPKIFIAYLSMLENQNALSMWLGDSDTSTIISHILRKYHEEKHILGINQFNLPDVR